MRTKTIIKYEIRHVLLFLVLAIVASLACIMRVKAMVFLTYRDLNSNIVDFYEGGNIVPYYINYIVRDIMPFVFIGLILLVLAQFTDTKRANTSEFVKSLPVKSGKWFTIRYLMGVVTITVPVIIATVGGYVIRSSYNDKMTEENALSDLYKYIKQNDAWWVILITMVLLWLVIVTLYTALVLFQVLVNRCVIAGIIGGIGIVFPYFLLRCSILFQISYLGISVNNINKPLIWITQWFATFTNGSQSYLYTVSDRSFRHVYFVLFDYLLLRLVLWIIFIATMFLVAFFLNKKRETAQKNDVFYSRLVEKIFFVCICIGCACLTSMLYVSSSVAVIVGVSITVGALIGVVMWRVSLNLHK